MSLAVEPRQAAARSAVPASSRFLRIVPSQRVADLETAVETLRRNADADRADLKQRIQVVQSDVARLRSEIRQETEERERRRRESLRTTITLQAIGTFFFVIGVVLSVIGTAVSC